MTTLFLQNTTGSSWTSAHKADHRASRHRFLAAYHLPPPLAARGPNGLVQGRSGRAALPSLALVLARAALALGVLRLLGDVLGLILGEAEMLPRPPAATAQALECLLVLIPIRLLPKLALLLRPAVPRSLVIVFSFCSYTHT